jgi:hypothetical protein
MVARKTSFRRRIPTAAMPAKAFDPTVSNLMRSLWSRTASTVSLPNM